MSEQMTAKVDVDLAQPSILSRRSPLRYVMLLAGLAVLVMLPYWIYPPVAMDILCWGLFAISVDLLLGFTGLLTFGHAAFWGGSAYCTGLIATHWGVPFPVAVLGGAVFAMLIAVADRLPVGAAHRHLLRDGHPGLRADALLRRQPVRATSPAARTVCRASRRNFFGIEPVETDPFYFYYVGAADDPARHRGRLARRQLAFGRVLTAVRDNPARARALGYDVERYKITAFIISAGLAGLAGGVFAVSHGSPRCRS